VRIMMLKSSMSPIRYKPLLLPRLVKIGAISTALLLSVWYVGFQARFIIEGPRVVLSPEPAVVYKDRVVTLNGTATNITALSINGRPIATDPEGNFSEPVVLENGYTIMSIDARDRYGRAVHIERPLVFMPDDSSATGELSLSK